MADSDLHEWLSRGRGLAPRAGWTFATDAPLVQSALARESGEVLAGDDSGGLYLLDRRGNVSALTRGLHPLSALAWSDNGQGGACAVSQVKLCRLSPRLEVIWSIDLPDVILAVAVDPHGQYIAAGLANGNTYIFDRNKRRVCDFETVRPLSFLRFLVTEPILIGVAEYGLLCCHQLNGEQIWNEKLWTNVGDVAVTGDGGSMLLAGFNHGIQMFDADGANRGSYVVEGTPKNVDMTFQPYRVVAATVEHDLYWLDCDGEMLWAVRLPEELRRLHCDPLGNWVVCGLASGRLIRLDWLEPDPE